MFGASCLLPLRQEAPPPVVSTTRPASALDLGITPAEQRVCALLLAGLSNKEIASELNRAEATIKNQVASILRKHGSRPARACWRCAAEPGGRSVFSIIALTETRGSGVWSF